MCEKSEDYLRELAMYIEKNRKIIPEDIRKDVDSRIRDCVRVGGENCDLYIAQQLDFLRRYVENAKTA